MHAKTAETIIRAFCLAYDLDLGPKPFRNPGTWTGEYGQSSEIIVMHEGSDADRALSLDGAYEHGDYSLYNALDDALREVGLYLEQCTRSYSAVYCESAGVKS